MLDPSKSPQFLDDCLHRSDFEAYLRVRVAAIEKDEDKLFRILGGWRPARVHRVIGNAYCDVVLENEDGEHELDLGNIDEVADHGVEKSSVEKVAPGSRRVRFENAVTFRPIPARGRCRRTPPRGTNRRTA